MKIIYFSKNYTPHDYRFLSSLAKTKHEVFYLQLEATSRQTEDRPVPKNVRRILWAGGRGEFRWRDVPRYVSSLRKVTREIQSDIIHAGPIQNCAFIAALSGFRHLLTMSWGYDLVMEADKNAWMRWVTRYPLRRSTFFTSDANTTCEKAISFGMNPDKTVVFPWGIELDHFHPKKEERRKRASVNRKSKIVNPTVGMEGRAEVTLPGTLLEAKPVDPKSLIVLRIADTRPHGALIYYDLRYVGLEPGKYDLRNYLARKDGSTTNDLPAIPVEIAGLLPAKHDGELLAQPEKPLPFLGGYKTLIVLVVALWALVLIPLWLIGRRRKSAPAVAAPMAAPTLADRLRPLVEQAAAGQLSRDGQAQLERLLLTHWRQRLNLEAEDMAEAIRRLRGDAEGGALLRELENWLHRPPGSVKVDVNKLLEPYR